MSNQISQLKQEVMTRVRFIYFTREALNSPMVKTVALFLLSVASTWYFSVVDVVNNLTAVSSNFGSLPSFFWSALINAHLEVQVLMALVLAVAVFLARDLVRSVRGPDSVLVSSF